MSCYAPYAASSEDMICLPYLENLYLDVPSLEEFRLEGWKMPAILRLVVPISNLVSRQGNSLDFVRLYGSRLVFLVINNHVQECLPTDFWTWCPVLTELTGRFAEIEIEGPIPSNHPLKHIIHFPASTWNVEANDASLLWQNMALFPFHLKSMIVTSEGGWSGYMRRLDKISKAEVEAYLQRLSATCAERFIRLEDENEATLDTFLATLNLG